MEGGRGLGRILSELKGVFDLYFRGKTTRNTFWFGYKEGTFRATQGGGDSKIEEGRDRLSLA